VFLKPTSGWATTSTFAAKLTASDGAANDNFGGSLTLTAMPERWRSGRLGQRKPGRGLCIRGTISRRSCHFQRRESSEVKTGGQLVYGIAVGNLGPGNAIDVVVTDQLPNGTTFVSAATTQGTCTFSNGTVTCHLGNLNKFTLTNPTGVGIKIVVQVTAAPGSTLTNTATVSAANPDPNPANNTATARTRVSGVAVEIDFVRACGLTPEHAAALRAELDRNKVVSVETSIDAAVAAKFRYTRP